MADIVIAILAIAIGAAFCFRGYLAMRIIIPIWGAFAGLIFGAGLVASLAGEGFLASLLGWLVGFGFALLFGALAYLYYEISVFIAMAAIGFSLGAAAMVAIGTEWSWLIILAGVLAGAVLALVAILADVPMALLTLLTAMAGSAAVVAGVMLLFGVVSLEDFGSAATTATLDDDWWWYALYVVLAIAGVVAQYTAAARMRGSLRESWSESGGRSMRTA